MKESFKKFRKTIPQNEYIYISFKHKIEFTTVKKVGTKYDLLYVDDECILGNKRMIILRR